MSTSHKILIVSNITTVIFAGILLIVFLGNHHKRSDHMGTRIVRDTYGDYKFTSPILDYEDLSSGEVSAIPVNSVTEVVDRLLKNNSISHISFYYRDLNNGQWIGINEKEEFSPASLLKVPILMAFLKQAERTPEILDKKIVVGKTEQSNVTQNIVSENRLVSGQTYTLLDVAKTMIRDSDNNAVPILMKEINPSYINGVFGSIGIPFENTKKEPLVMVKDYAGFFRVLYNASYLNREMSELALSILSESNYNNGIVNNLPDGILVAHKFGERDLVNAGDGKEVSGEKQFHDCGIVYNGKNPYIICIMTRGTDFKVLESAIQELSDFIFDRVGKK